MCTIFAWEGGGGQFFFENVGRAIKYSTVFNWPYHSLKALEGREGSSLRKLEWRYFKLDPSWERKTVHGSCTYHNTRHDM